MGYFTRLLWDSIITRLNRSGCSVQTAVRRELMELDAASLLKVREEARALIETINLELSERIQENDR